MAKTYNIFISHSWTYNYHYQKLIKLLDARPYFNYNNHSIPIYDPIHNAPRDKDLYDAIKRKINGTHAILIMAGVYSSYSKWIDKEIQIAKNEYNMTKPIIAIEPYGSERTSTKVKDAADEIVRWNTDSIVSAIKKVSL